MANPDQREVPIEDEPYHLAFVLHCQESCMRSTVLQHAPIFLISHSISPHRFAGASTARSDILITLASRSKPSTVVSQPSGPASSAYPFDHRRTGSDLHGPSSCIHQ